MHSRYTVLRSAVLQWWYIKMHNWVFNKSLINIIYSLFVVFVLIQKLIDSMYLIVKMTTNSGFPHHRQMDIFIIFHYDISYLLWRMWHENVFWLIWLQNKREQGKNHILIEKRKVGRLNHSSHPLSETTSALCCLLHWTHYNLHTAVTVPQTMLLPSPCTLLSPTWKIRTPMWGCCSWIIVRYLTP